MLRQANLAIVIMVVCYTFIAGCDNSSSSSGQYSSSPSRSSALRIEDGHDWIACSGDQRDAYCDAMSARFSNRAEYANVSSAELRREIDSFYLRGGNAARAQRVTEIVALIVTAKSFED